MDRFNRWGLMNSLIAILNEGNDSTDVFIAKYFMKNFGRMHDLNVYDVAQECFVDRATIRRFAQKLGYANFKEMKEQFENYNQKIQESVNELAMQLKLSEGSDYEKELKVYDWMCQNIVYDSPYLVFFQGR